MAQVNTDNSCKLNIISLLPMIFAGLEYGVVGRAINKKQIQLQHWNPRDYVNNTYKKVDDKPYGGGPGMVMQAEPIQACVQAISKTYTTKPYTIYLSPQGKLLTSNKLQSLAKHKNITLICGRYEGIDQRCDSFIDETISIGNYVLSGGEIAGMVFIDALSRWIPGVLGNSASAASDSFSQGLLDYPNFTRPKTINSQTVPSALTNGDHNEIDDWRLQQALGKTWENYPELLIGKYFSKKEQQLLATYIHTQHAEVNGYE